MKVETSAVLCPQCGAPLTGKMSGGIIVCQYCGTPIRVTNYSDGTDDGGKAVIRDINSGMELCHAETPDGWTSMGALSGVLQSANFPLVLTVRSASRDGRCEFGFKSGESYNSVVDSPMHRHSEGAFDSRLLMPYRRFLPLDGFCAAVFSEQCPGAQNVRELLKDELPYEDESKKHDFARLRSDMINQIQAAFARYNATGATQSRLNDVYYDGGIRLYEYEKGGEKFVYAVSAMMNAVDSTMQTRIGYFADTVENVVWECGFTFTMSAPFEKSRECYDAFKRFMVTLNVSDAYLAAFANAKANAQNVIRNNLAEYNRSWQQINRQARARNEANWQRMRRNSDEIWNIRESTRQGISDTNDRVADMQSEAIRGQNTYYRADGSTVEYSVMNEKVYGYNNDPLTTLGVDSTAFEPGAGWTELKRRF